MKWIILGVAVILLLPFYVFILSKSATLGRLTMIRTLKHNNLMKGEIKRNGKEKEK
jgi:hypothetical protein